MAYITSCNSIAPYRVLELLKVKFQVSIFEECSSLQSRQMVPRNLRPFNILLKHWAADFPRLISSCALNALPVAFNTNFNVKAIAPGKLFRKATSPVTDHMLSKLRAILFLLSSVDYVCERHISWATWATTATSAQCWDPFLCCPSAIGRYCEEADCHLPNRPSVAIWTGKPQSTSFK